ncbi:hypothetical protein [Borreliella valaisiana]|uniref:hypothetical protein n=1 Tax=Borreliella valaisiana TaxID=62088 RepID=UPI001F37CA28|nr:hypothetical protein [Borreliella valaisiana]
MFSLFKKGKTSVFYNIAYIDIITKLEKHVFEFYYKTSIKNAYKMNRKTQNNNNSNS